MTRDTKRIEALLEGTRSNRALVREELEAGTSMQHVYDQLGDHERYFASRLVELCQHNKRQAADSEQPEA